LPEVDPKSVVVWGGSGGGDLALQIAGETSLAAIVPEEPAVVLMMGMMTTKTPRKGEKYTPADATEMCEQPQRYYTPEIQAITRQKIAKINCPIFLPEGGASLINRINNEIFIPELVKAGKNIKVVVYPGQPHVFAMGNRDPLAALWCFNDAESFLSRYIGAKARPIDPSLVEILSLSTQ
jgi:acetyl esterase/lipase